MFDDGAGFFRPIEDGFVANSDRPDAALFSKPSISANIILQLSIMNFSVDLDCNSCVIFSSNNKIAEDKSVAVEDNGFSFVATSQAFSHIPEYFLESSFCISLLCKPLPARFLGVGRDLAVRVAPFVDFEWVRAMGFKLSSMVQWGLSCRSKCSSMLLRRTGVHMCAFDRLPSL